MKKGILLILLTLISYDSFAQNLDWVRGFGGSGLDEGRDVATDAAGNVYLTGYFSSTVDFNPGAGVYNLTAFGSYDGYVMKLDAAGNFVWAKQFGGVNEEFFENIALDNAGNIFIGGMFGNTIDFDPGPLIYNLTSNGGEDIFILKLNPSGNFLWVKSVGGSNADYNESIAVDPSGNVYAVGSFTFTVDFDPGPAIFNLNWSNASGYMLKLDASGNFVWAYGIRGNCEDIHIDGSGNIYHTGSFGGTTDFDPGAGIYNLTASAGDMFITKFNSAGNFIWAKNMGGNMSVESLGICTDINGNVYTTGRFEGTVDFNPGAATNNVTSNGDWDAFISKIDALGNFVWVDKIGGTMWEYAFDIDIDATGNVYVAGAFQDVVDFDPGAGVNTLTAQGQVNAYTLKLNSSGGIIWVIPIYTFAQIYTYAVAANDDGSCCTAGDFSYSTDFDPAPGFQLVSPVGGADAYLCKWSSCNSLPSTGNISGNTSLCTGVTSSYSTPTVSGATGYNWTVPVGANINSGQNTNSINVTMGSNSGNVTVTPYNSCVSGTTSILPVTVNSLPTASSISANGNTTFCSGSSVVLFGNSGGTWNTGATSSSITVTSSGNYYVTNSNACGNVISNQINVTVTQAPTPSNISANGNTTFCVGGSVTLIGNVGGTWNNGSTSSSITVTTSGNYFVTNSNACGSVNSNLITVTVNPLPNPSFISANGNTTFCNGASVTLSGNSGGVWNNGSSAPSITVTTSGNYYVTNSNSCGNVLSNQINVTVIQAPTPSNISANGNTTFCAGGSVTLSGNVGGTWNNGSTSPSITVSTGGNYFVTNSNSCGSVNSNPIIVTVNQLPNASFITANGNTTFCAGGSVTLSGNVGGTWNNGSTSPSITVSTSGNYFVTNSNSCGIVNSNQINVIVNPLPIPATISAGGLTTFCNGNFVILFGNTSGIWSNGSSSSSITVTASGDYFVTNSNSCGNSISNHIVVTVENPPIASFIQATGPTQFCSGDSVVLIGNTGGIWNNGLDSTSITVITSGDYFVTTINSCGSATSNHILVDVWPLPPTPNINLVGNNLEVATGYTNYQWYLNNTLMAGETQSYITPTLAGVYTVTVSDTNACMATSQPYNFVPVGISNGSGFQFNIYPNPASTEIKVEIPSLYNDNPIEIINLQGQIQLSEIITDSHTSINIQHLTSGIYFVRFSNQTIKLIKY